MEPARYGGFVRRWWARSESAGSRQGSQELIKVSPVKVCGRHCFRDSPVVALSPPGSLLQWVEGAEGGEALPRPLLYRMFRGIVLDRPPLQDVALDAQCLTHLLKLQVFALRN